MNRNSKSALHQTAYHRPRVDSSRLLMVLIGCVSALFLAEGAARIWVARRWSADERYVALNHTAVRGRFAYDPLTGYALSSNYRSRRRTHNALGLRGPQISATKNPGTWRIVLAGASTVYGEKVADQETSAAQLELILRQVIGERSIEVLNAGVPGWTSAETAMSFSSRIVRLVPDIVVVMDGRNDAFPQLFNNYKDDYSHYRHPGHDFRMSNYWHKKVFRISHLAMLMSVGGLGHFGFSGIAEFPLYGSIRFENRPTLNEMRQNAADDRRSEGFRRNLERVIESARANNIEIILATIPYRPDGYASGVIPNDPKTLPFVTSRVRRNQEITRELANSYNLSLVDAAARFSTGEYLVDDCHFNPAGERAFANLLSVSIRSILEKRASVPNRG